MHDTPNHEDMGVIIVVASARAAPGLIRCRSLIDELVSPTNTAR